MAKTKKNSEPDTVLNCNNGFLECYRCGRWFDYNGKILPASMDFACSVMSAFGKQHKHCSRSGAGIKLEAAAQKLNDHVAKVMAENGWTQVDIDAGKGQGLLPVEIKKFMSQDGTWQFYMKEVFHEF